MALDLAPALDVLRTQIPGLAGVYLFGSGASGDMRADSDVDLAVFAGRPIARAHLLEVQERAAAALRRDVDLIDLAAAPTILQAQAMFEGKLVAAADPDAIAFFEVRVLREYQDLKARRVEIEADIVARGRVYGR